MLDLTEESEIKEHLSTFPQEISISYIRCLIMAGFSSCRAYEFSSSSRSDSVNVNNYRIHVVSVNWWHWFRRASISPNNIIQPTKLIVIHFQSNIHIELKQSPDFSAVVFSMMARSPSSSLSAFSKFSMTLSVSFFSYLFITYTLEGS